MMGKKVSEYKPQLSYSPLKNGKGERKKNEKDYGEKGDRLPPAKVD